MLTVLMQIPDVTAPPEDGRVSTWLLGTVIAMLVAVVAYVLRNTNRHTTAAERFTDMLAKGELLPANAVEREKQILKALETATRAMDSTAESQKALTTVINEVIAEHRQTRELMFSQKDFRG